MASRWLGATVLLGAAACMPTREPKLGDTGADTDTHAPDTDEGASSGTDGVDTQPEGAVGLCEYALPGDAPLNVHAQTGPIGDDLARPSAAACGDDGRDGEDVVFSWVAPTRGIHRFAVGGITSAPLLAVFAECSGAELLGCAHASDDGPSEVAVMLEAGQQIALLIDDTVPGGSTEYVLSITPP